MGDIIGVTHPTSLIFEERNVMTIASQRTLTIDFPFSSDLVSTCTYLIRKDSITLRLAVLEKEGEGDVGPNIDDRVRDLLICGNSCTSKVMPSRQRTTMLVREKTGMWSYKTRVEKLDKTHTAEELLDMRIKKQGRDKYC